MTVIMGLIHNKIRALAENEDEAISSSNHHPRPPYWIAALNPGTLPPIPPPKHVAARKLAEEKRYHRHRQLSQYEIRIGERQDKGYQVKA